MLERTRGLVGPLPLYLATEAVFALWWSTIVTVNLVYQATVVGLSPLELVLVGTLIEAVCLVSEVPTGVVADLHSRRLSVVVGIFLTGAGFVLEGSVAELWAVLAAQVVWGVGATFISGALEAWLADETSEGPAAAASLRAAQVARGGSVLGIGVAVALAAAGGVRLPIVAGGLALALAAPLLLCLMPEHGVAPQPRPDGERRLRAMARTAGAGVALARRRPVARALVGASPLAGLAAE